LGVDMIDGYMATESNREVFCFDEWGVRHTLF
jgi:hypothetical protein